MSELPKAWRTARLVELARIRMGKTILAKELSEAGIPVYSAGKENRPWGYVASSDLTFDDKTIVLSARGSIGFPKLPATSPFVSTQTTIALQAETRSLAEWLCTWLATLDWNAQTSGASIPMITVGQLERFDVPLPEPSEQRRIVAKLEALQARSRRAREALDAIPPLLEKLRQSILAAAFRGDLTKEWRAKNPDVEPATELLKRIRVERRAKWEEAELAKMVAKGKAPKDDRWKAKYEEPKPVDATGLPELPEGWCWATLGHIAPLQPGFAFPSSGFRRSGLRLLKGVNVRDGYIASDDLDHWDPAESGGVASFRLDEGDIVLAMDRPVYSSGTKGTKVARLDHSWQGSLLLQRVGRFQVGPSVTHDYLYLYLRSAAFRAHLIAQQKGSQDGKDLPHVSGGAVDSAVVAVPPYREQQCIVDRCRELSLEDRTAGLPQRLTEMDRRILSRAFRGELLPAIGDDNRPIESLTDPDPPRPKANYQSPAAKGRRRKASR